MTKMLLLIFLVFLTVTLTSADLIDTFETSTLSKNLVLFIEDENDKFTLQTNSSLSVLNNKLKLVKSTPFKCVGKCQIDNSLRYIHLERFTGNISNLFMSCEISVCVKYALNNIKLFKNESNFASVDLEAEQVRNNLNIIYNRDTISKNHLLNINVFTCTNKINATEIVKRNWDFNANKFTNAIPIISAKENIDIIFSYENKLYLYYVAVRNLPSGEHENILIRICIAENSENAYTEVLIKCSDNNYGKITSSSIIAGVKAITDEEFETLYVAMAKNDSTSIICAYSYKQISKVFHKNIKRCINGKGNTGLQYKGKNKPCVPSESNGTHYFCSDSINGPIKGLIPLARTPILSLEKAITSIKAVAWLRTPFLLIGLSNGHVLQSHILIYSKDNKVILKKEEVVDEGYPIKRLYSSKSIGLLAMTEKKVVTIEPAF